MFVFAYVPELVTRVHKTLALARSADQVFLFVWPDGRSVGRSAPHRMDQLSARVRTSHLSRTCRGCRLHSFGYLNWCWAAVRRRGGYEDDVHYLYILDIVLILCTRARA